jgi:4-carboxymuconolactone decarboxylase
MSADAQRLPLLVPPPQELEGLYRRLDEANGRVHNFFATVAHHQPLLQRIVSLAGLFFKSDLIPPRDRELVILRVGWRTGSHYEFGQHTLLARANGLTDDEIKWLTEPAADHRWGDADAVLISMVDELCADDAVGDGTWEKLTAHHSPAQTVELLMLAGYYRMIAGFLNSCRVEPDPGAPGWP